MTEFLLLNIAKDLHKDLFGTDDWTRTSTSEENGFWIRRVYQFRHIGIVISGQIKIVNED